MVFWVAASSPSRIEQGFLDIARSLSVPCQSNSAIEVVVRWLRERSSSDWIVVLDDFQAGEVKSSLESPHAGNNAVSQSSTLIFQNTGLLDLGNLNYSSFVSEETRLLVTIPNHPDSIAMLRRKLSPTPYPERDLRDLVQALQYSPLAITLAACYIKENAIGPQDYLAEFMSLQSELEAPFVWHSELSQEQREIPKSVVRAFLLAVKQVRMENSDAIEILSLATVLDRQIIPTALLFHSHYGVRPFHRAIAKLQAFSLISKRRLGENYSMNRCVQQLCEICLRSQGKFGYWKKQVLVLIAKRYGQGDQSFWRICEMINPHAHKSLVDSKFVDRSCMPHGVLLRCMASYEQLQGNYIGAYEKYIEAHAIFQESGEYGKNHRETFSIAERAAGVLTFLDRNEEAEVKINEVRGDMERTLGAEDHQFLASGDTLAKIYVDQGKYGQAEELYRKALKANVEAHHETHVDSLTIKSNLALLLRDQGKYDEAETYFRETLEGSKLERDMDHPDTLHSMSNLATVLTRQGKYVDAEKLNSEALAISERVQGPEHPDTLSMLNNLAIDLANLGRYEEAEQMHRRHVAVKERTLGRENSNTIVAKLNLAVLLDKMGKLGESEKEYEEALNANLKLLGEDNKTTLNLWSSLGVVYLKQKKYEKAENMIRKSLEQREKLLGSEHQLTLISRNNLAGVMQRLGRYEEAEKGFRDVLLTASRTMGDNHPQVLRARNNLGELLREAKMKLDESETLLRNARTGRRKELGKDHPDTLVTTYNLAHLLHDKRLFDNAEPLYKEALEGMTERLGEYHSSTIDCAKNFRLMVEERGRAATATDN